MAWADIRQFFFGRRLSDDSPQVAKFTDDERMLVDVGVVPVTGTQQNALTNDELRASPVPVSTGQLQALTNDELRSSPVPVSTGQDQALTNDQLRVAPVDVADSGEREYIHVVATASQSGDTEIYTPSPGKRVVLRWIYAINDPTSGAAPMIKVKLGGEEKYRVWALSKRQKVTGPINGKLVINLTAAGNVAVTAILEEI